jgi:lauroyl/myristoyl acyltransferase
METEQMKWRSVAHRKIPTQEASQGRPFSMNQLSTAKFIGPYDLYLLLVMALIKLLNQCPFLRVKDFFTHAVAFMAFHLSRRGRRVKERALAQTLRLSEPAVRNIAKHAFYDFWSDIFIGPSLRRDKKSGQVNEVQGIEHLKEALQKGRGVILWESSFFGRRVLAKRILHEKAFSVCQVHSEYHIGGFHNPKTWMSVHVIQPFFNNRERPFVKEIIPLSRSESLTFTKDLLARLKQNDIIAIAADGSIGHKFIPVEFLDRTDLFSTGMVSLARLSGATILPFFCVHNEDRTALIIESPICIEADGDRERGLEKAIRQYARLLECYVKKYPQQYRNWHGLVRSESGPHARY